MNKFVLWLWGTVGLRVTPSQRVFNSLSGCFAILSRLAARPTRGVVLGNCCLVIFQ